MWNCVSGMAVCKMFVCTQGVCVWTDPRVLGDLKVLWPRSMLLKIKQCRQKRNYGKETKYIICLQQTRVTLCEVFYINMENKQINFFK